MARFYDILDEFRHGSLEVEALSSNHVEVYYIPSKEKLALSKLNYENTSEIRVKLLEFDGENMSLTIFPINMLGHTDNFLQPKYKKIERITLVTDKLVVFDSDSTGMSKGFKSVYYGPTVPLDHDFANIDSLKLTPSTQEEVMEVLEGLPQTFTKDYDYGLGLAKAYKYIIDAVENLSNCIEIVISNQHTTRISKEENRFYISIQDFEEARKTVNRINNNSQKAAYAVKEGTIYNLFAEKIGKPKVPVTSGHHPLRKLFTVAAQGKEPLSADDQLEVLNIVEKNVNAIAETEPEKLTKLKIQIELASFEIVITRFEEMIARKVKESKWQTFLNENPFILTLAFGYPIIKVQNQAWVGGRKLSGGGEKIADFAVRNSMTNNIAIIDIKTPQEQLLNRKPFRDGVYTPSSALSGSVNQMLDQKYQFERNVAQIKENSRIQNIESYSVHCCLIIGAMPLSNDEIKSFEHFRQNSKNVEIVTFDELLEKLKELRNFMISEHS